MAITGLNAELTGWAEPCLVSCEHGMRLEQQTARAYARMQIAAAAQGFDLRMVSAYRNFAHQARIWQAKMNGQRPVYDINQKPVDISVLHGFVRLEAVLLYSALPGASRHHWGTDLDLYDAAAVPSTYQATLDPTEYQGNGHFTPMVHWLDENAGTFGFFKPYRQFQGGVAPEPWHFSYAPVANEKLAAFSAEILAQAISESELTEKPLILKHIDLIYRRFIANITTE